MASGEKFILSYGAGVNSTALMIHLIRNKMPLDCVVFADSIVGSSPIIIRKKPTNMIDVVTLEDFWNTIDSSTITHGSRERKTVSNVDILSGSPALWTPIKTINRHRYDGSIIRIITRTGAIDTSPNHSLIKPGGIVANARYISKGNRLSMPLFFRTKEICTHNFFVGSRRIAWLLGLFAAEGSIHHAKRGKYVIKISNSNLKLLDQSKKILSVEFNCSASIVNETNGMYAAMTQNMALYNYLSFHGYTKDSSYPSRKRDKKVPDIILNAPLSIVRAYFEGYMAGDGNIDKGKYPRFTTKYQILAMGLLILAKRLGFGSYGLNYRTDKKAYDIHLNKGKNIKDPREVLKKCWLPNKGFLYDLETGDHSFCTGIGPIRAHNTGAEVPETYEYLKIAEAYLKTHEIPLVIVQSKRGSLYDTCVRRRVIPSMVWRWSTRDYKIGPIYRFYRGLNAHVNQYLGIAYDELERMKDSKADYVTNIYPLVDEKITREKCIQIIKNGCLPVPVRSGCWLCPFNNTNRWFEIYQAHPELYRKAMRLEEQGKHFPKQKLTPLTLRELVKRFKKGKIESMEPPTVPCGGECMT